MKILLHNEDLRIEDHGTHLRLFAQGRESTAWKAGDSQEELIAAIGRLQKFTEFRVAQFLGLVECEPKKAEPAKTRRKKSR